MESRAKRIRIIRRTGFITFEFHHSSDWVFRARLTGFTSHFAAATSGRAEAYPSMGLN
jgi:hypothetical protein